MNPSKDSLIKARDDYIALVKNELLGPGSENSIPDKEHELLSSSPKDRYLVGILFPRNNKLNVDNDDPSTIEESFEKGGIESDTQDIGEINPTEKSVVVLPSEENNLDEEISLSTQNMPSSLGMTFLTSCDLQDLKCGVTFATYRQAKISDCKVALNTEYSVPVELSNYIYFDKNESCLRFCDGLNSKGISDFQEMDLSGLENKTITAITLLNKQLKAKYVRVPHKTDVVVNFSGGNYVDNNKKLDKTSAKITALKRKLRDDLYSFTVMLVNDSLEKSSGSTCIFQPKIEVSSAQNGFKFMEYSALSDFNSLDEEEQSLALQYRNRKVYGTGLGTSVNWHIDKNGQGKIWSDIFPEVEIPALDISSVAVNYGIPSSALSMRFLSDLDKSTKIKKIHSLKTVIDAYGDWIADLDKKLSSLAPHFHNIGENNIKRCRKAQDRMLKGISVLENNDLAWQAFMLANKAMFMQRVHLKLQQENSNVDRYPDDPTISDILDSIDYTNPEGKYTSDQYFWYLFQIAFLLMSIEGIVNDYSDERDIVDLIWFPTGGGKTEAYLGLTAFTIFYRRLAHTEKSAGTTVIMRYTLRLLASQQFTRASTLICACEYIRKSFSKLKRFEKNPLGDSEITIGLWIGGTHTPNKNKEARDCVHELQAAARAPYSLWATKEKYNKFQVLKCPWCGTKMVQDVVAGHVVGSLGYVMRRNEKHFELFCPQNNCPFTEKLPIQVVDEELYANPPTLLFGTVDKFAMLPWKKEIGAFFATNAGNNNRSPDLIIQDELHLISGPLGTMVGLYESAIDVLCRKNDFGPKIVASTATIRKAKEQCSALYNRDVNQFPHPGLDAEDSFFARELQINHEKGMYGRKYIGLMPSGKTKAYMEARTIAALMQRINTMDLPEEIKDNFWTLTAYFNSLKDLGKCSTLVDDDVKDSIKRISFRLGETKKARLIAGSDELTSRVNTTALNETLDRLEKRRYSKQNIEDKRYPVNILLATNMISVGIDVARLNVMLLVGQPKLTSEYIQASSRIGRSSPGVAFVMYDGSKSRDRSHYEQFKSYHESFYRFVEPTGATPFAKPARDRALHAVFIALMRQLEPKLTLEKDAAGFVSDSYWGTISRLREFIITRASEVSNRLNPNMKVESSEMSTEIDSIFEKWEQLIKRFGKEHFCYGERFMVIPPRDIEGRLLKQFNTSVKDPAFDTMTSMRSVDSMVAGNVLIWED